MPLMFTFRCRPAALMAMLCSAFFASAFFAAACNVDDTGTLCESPNTVFVTQPIVGETPVVEVVNLTRDPNCFQFSCLTSQGLPSYCTHSCRYNTAPEKPAACAADTDCTLPLHCHAGICNDDNCPPGFFCEVPETTGSLGSTAYCVHQTGCTTDPDCGEVSTVSCIKVGCYDSCLNSADPCLLHQRLCAPLTDLHCTCAGQATVCADSALTCKPNNSPTAFAAGSVTQEGVCLPKT